ncbi:MAG: type IIL restriction-modification enzyme MmeI, partial [bacterium]
MATHNAGVTVAIIGIGNPRNAKPKLFSEVDNKPLSIETENINAYLVASSDIFVDPQSKSRDDIPTMFWGNKPTDGGFLILDRSDLAAFSNDDPRSGKFIKNYYGSEESIKGNPRACIWVEDK